MLAEALPGLAPEIRRAKKDQVDLKAVALELRRDPARADAVDVVCETDQTDSRPRLAAGGHV